MLTALMMFLAPAGAEPTSGGGQVPPPPPNLVQDVVKQIGQGGKPADVLKSFGIKVKTATVEEWNPRGKAFDPETLTITQLPEMSTSTWYEISNPTRGSKGIRLAQMAKVLLYAQKFSVSKMDAAEMYRRRGQLDEFVFKALNESNLADGGPLVPPQFAAEMIPLLRAAQVLFELGIRIVPMSSNELIYSLQNTPAVAYYVGEGAPATYSQAKTGQLKLLLKKLVALTAITDELLKDGGVAADEFLRDDLVQVSALRDDLAGLRGDGTLDTPLGLRYQVDAAQVFAATQVGATATHAEVNADLGKMQRLVDESNVPKVKRGWAFTPRVEWFLRTLINNQGFYIFAEQMDKGLLFGKPFKTTTQIPQTLGSGTNETEVYYGEWSELVKGEGDDMTLEFFPGGTYDPGTGTLVSGIVNGTTPVKMARRHDYKLRHTNVFAILKTCKWGA